MSEYYVQPRFLHPDQPFQVVGTGVVTNLNADTVDGLHADELGGGGISDGDKGHITVAGAGANWTINTAQPTAHTWAAVQTFTLAPVFTDAAGTRTALGLGTLATQSGTFSGSSSGTNTGDQNSVTGNAGTVTVADAGGDTTTWLLLGTAQTGSLAPATDAALTYDATANSLSIAGTTTGTPGHLAINQAATRPAITITGAGTDLGGSDTAKGVGWWFVHNTDGNHQLVLGETDGFNNFLTACFSFNFLGGIASIRGITGDGVYPLPINLGTGDAPIAGNYADVVVGNSALAYNVATTEKFRVYQQADRVAVGISAAASGTADLQRWCNSSNVSLLKVTITGVLESALTTGTAPFTVASTTRVANLNADLVDGMHAAEFVPAASKIAALMEFF